MNCFMYLMENKSLNLDAKLRKALLCRYMRRQSEVVDEMEARWMEERKETFSYTGKTSYRLLRELDEWLEEYRPECLGKLIDPIGKAQLKQFNQFEQSTGLKLPEEYKLLLSWRGSQQNQIEYDLDPFAEEALMSLEAAVKTRDMLNGLVKAGRVPEDHWGPNWLPFMADIFGNNTCIDLSPESYGEVLIFDHEIGGRIFLCENMTAWLAELVDKLQFLVHDLEESECVD